MHISTLLAQKESFIPFYPVKLVYKDHFWEIEKWSSQGVGLYIEVKSKGKCILRESIDLYIDIGLYIEVVSHTG